MIKINPVVLCGGSGSRLWPVSRSGLPKQFLSFINAEPKLSLFKQSVSRANSMYGEEFSLGATYIVTNDAHRFLALDQVKGIKNSDALFLLEPEGRNTAPALTMAALQACCDNQLAHNDMVGDSILLVMPSDQLILDEVAFNEALKNCIGIVHADNQKNTIAILGIKPTFPSTGYGYIHRSKQMGVGKDYFVESFTEKPNFELASFYLDNEDYFWNSGIFVLYASTWIAAIKTFRDDIFSATEIAWKEKKIDKFFESSFIRPDADLYKKIPSESIDYAVIEKCPSSLFNLKMLELNAGWSDLGTWDSVWKSGAKDKSGNLISGDVLSLNTKNSLISSESRLVATIGVENLIVVETTDAVLVVDQNNSQYVKELVALLTEKKRVEKNLHRKVFRPWGWYDSLDEGINFKVKRIHVNVNGSLSLQKHEHRAEHWVVVKGVAEVTIGKKIIFLNENESAYIPPGEIHRLVNKGVDILEIIEVQSGSYLGEDDIVRFEDIYGR
jgi:mannose-1-phosphate guanylyltransferase / mannose-6-phosphate isomerase